MLPWTPYLALIHIYHSSLHLCRLALADSHGASLCLCLPDTGELCIPLKLRQSIDWLAERNYALRPLAYNKFQNLTIQPWLACNFICRSDWLELGDLTASASWVLQGKACWAVHPHARPKQRHFTAGSDSKNTQATLSWVASLTKIQWRCNRMLLLNSTVPTFRPRVTRRETSSEDCGISWITATVGENPRKWLTEWLGQCVGISWCLPRYRSLKMGTQWNQE